MTVCTYSLYELPCVLIAVEEDDPQEPYHPDFAELMQDPRVQAVVHRIMYHRGLMRASMPHMPPGVAGKGKYVCMQHMWVYVSTYVHCMHVLYIL